MSQNTRTDGRREIVDKIRREFPDIDDARARQIVKVVVEHMKESVRKVDEERKQRALQDLALAIAEPSRTAHK
jgi:hypothetical protein